MTKLIIEISIGIIIISIFIWVFISIVKSPRYLQDIIWLETFVTLAQPTERNFKFILDRFDELAKNNCDKDRTKKLFFKYRYKYGTFWTALVLKDKDADLQHFCKIQNKIDVV